MTPRSIPIISQLLRRRTQGVPPGPGAPQAAGRRQARQAASARRARPRRVASARRPVERGGCAPARLLRRAGPLARAGPSPQPSAVGGRSTRAPPTLQGCQITNASACGAPGRPGGRGAECRRTSRWLCGAPPDPLVASVRALLHARPCGSHHPPRWPLGLLRPQRTAGQRAVYVIHACTPHTRARTPAHTHAHTRAHTHTHTHQHTHTHTQAMRLVYGPPSTPPWSSSAPTCGSSSASRPRPRPRRARGSSGGGRRWRSSSPGLRRRRGGTRPSSARRPRRGPWTRRRRTGARRPAGSGSTRVRGGVLRAVALPGVRVGLCWATWVGVVVYMGSCTRLPGVLQFERVSVARAAPRSQRKGPRASHLAPTAPRPARPAAADGEEEEAAPADAGDFEMEAADDAAFDEEEWV